MCSYRFVLNLRFASWFINYCSSGLCLYFMCLCVLYTHAWWELFVGFALGERRCSKCVTHKAFPCFPVWWCSAPPLHLPNVLWLTLLGRNTSKSQRHVKIMIILMHSWAQNTMPPLFPLLCAGKRLENVRLLKILPQAPICRSS